MERARNLLGFSNATDTHFACLSQSREYFMMLFSSHSHFGWFYLCCHFRHVVHVCQHLCLLTMQCINYILSYS